MASKHIGQVTRDNQEASTTYVVGEEEIEAIFVVAIDGIGRYWYDTLEDVEADFGELPIIYADKADE